MPKLWSSTFEGKLAASRRLLRAVLKRHANPVVACSFGKDSMVVLHLVRQFRSGVPVLWNNTSIEYPETYKFKARIEKEWNLTVIEAKPTRDFWWVIENYGFPLYARKGNKDASKNCCAYLKDYPAQKVLRQHKFDLYFTGLRSEESTRRFFSARNYGPYFHSKRLNYWKCHPILEWTKEDVWRYHELYRLPANPLYQRGGVEGFEVRTACWARTIPIKHGKVEFLRRNYPKLWKHLLRSGLAKVIIEEKTGRQPDSQPTEVYIDRLIESRPCFFDRV
jgi:3'-phosphoadenosine 5'-phosphosulfate sulfotransferase (PAPS reductase)/FAD synthetase